MIFANIGILGVKSGHRDKVVEILVRSKPDLEANGCLLYEVGINNEFDNTVFVSELWESSEAHKTSLQLHSVQSAIQEAMPFLSGEMSGNQFSVVGSPLRDSKPL